MKAKGTPFIIIKRDSCPVRNENPQVPSFNVYLSPGICKSGLNFVNTMVESKFYSRGSMMQIKIQRYCIQSLKISKSIDSVFTSILYDRIAMTIDQNAVDQYAISDRNKLRLHITAAVSLKRAEMAAIETSKLEKIR